MNERFETFVVLDASRATSEEKEKETVEFLNYSGVKIIRSDEVINFL